MKAALSCALLLLLLLTGANPVAAQSTSPTVRWDRFDVDITAQTDGSLAVREVQTITFRGQLREGFRVISTDRTTGVSDVAVSEVTASGEQPYVRGAGQPGTFSVEQQSEGLGVTWWFVPATDSSRTFVLSYVAHGAIRQYPDGDQVFWQAAYADRPGPVASGTIAVHLPVDTPSSMPSALYLIDTRGNPTREVGPGRHVDARTVQFALPQLPESTGAEVRVGFPHGAITAPPPPWQAEADRADQIRQSVGPIGTFLALLLTLAIVVGGGIALFLLWYTRGREPAIGATPRELDQPPSDLPAPLAGTLLDGRADLQDAVAALVDLGDQGVVSMTEEPGHSDVLVSLHRPTDDPALRPYERVLLTALFDSGASSGQIRLSDARTRFAAAVPVLEERLHAAVAAEGLFTENPQQVRTRYMALGVVLVAAGLGAAVLAGVLLGWAVPIIWLPGVALALIGGVTIALAQAMTRRTPRGALEAARWGAFRAHLADEQQQGAIDPHHLAYAVAFGMDRAFLRRLEQVGSPAPVWYGPGPVVVVPGGWYGDPRHGGSDGSGGGSGPIGVPTGTPGSVSPQGWSDALSGLLTAASDALAHGGGSGGWSGGSFGGGGGGGGGSGGFR
jgi:hypothetical protein